MISGHPTRTRLARIPGLRRLFHLAPIQPRETFALDRHPRFVDFLRRLESVEICLHGLHHVKRGLPLHVELRDADRSRARRTIRRAQRIFARAGLPTVPGFAPPGWHLSRPLALALADRGLRFVASARDLETVPSPDARTHGDGLRGAPLQAPSRLTPSGLLHFPVNYQATSTPERAFRILDTGGLLSIKAHVEKRVLDHVLADGLDEEYRGHLDQLFSALEDRYGESLWWTSMGAIEHRLRTASEP